MIKNHDIFVIRQAIMENNPLIKDVSFTQNLMFTQASIRVYLKPPFHTNKFTIDASFLIDAPLAYVVPILLHRIKGVTKDAVFTAMELMMSETYKDGFYAIAYKSEAMAAKILTPQEATALYNEMAKASGSTYSSGIPQEKLKTVVPGLSQTVVCPECAITKSLWEVVQHINDGHKWDFKAIADWLETLDVDIKFKNTGAA